MVIFQVSNTKSLQNYSLGACSLGAYTGCHGVRELVDNFSVGLQSGGLHFGDLQSGGLQSRGHGVTEDPHTTNNTTHNTQRTTHNEQHSTEQ